MAETTATMTPPDRSRPAIHFRLTRNLAGPPGIPRAPSRTTAARIRHKGSASADFERDLTADVPTGRAIAASQLSGLPPALRAQVLADALPVDLPAGAIIYRDEDAPRVVLVITGLVRVVLSAPDSRTDVTIRYARAGDLSVGVLAVVGGPAPVSVRLVTDGRVLMLNARTLRHLGQTEPAVGWLLAGETARRAYDMIDAVADNAFGSLRQRVARHLLDLATSIRDGQCLAAVTQQELAEAVGSARPAVARVVAELRDLDSWRPCPGAW